MATSAGSRARLVVLSPTGSLRTCEPARHETAAKSPHLDPTWGQRVANQPLVTTADADPCEAAARRYTRSDIFIGPAAASRSLRGARVLSILRQLSSLVWSPLKWHLGTFLIFLFKLWGQTCKVNHKIQKSSQGAPLFLAEILWHGKKLEKP